MIQWRTSSHSQGGQGECIEVSTGVADASLIRDSKDPDGPRLSLRRSDLAVFLSNVKSGRYRR
jgi:hypothetical protein